MHAYIREISLGLLSWAGPPSILILPLVFSCRDGLFWRVWKRDVLEPKRREILSSRRRLAAEGVSRGVNPTDSASPLVNSKDNGELRRDRRRSYEGEEGEDGKPAKSQLFASCRLLHSTIAAGFQFQVPEWEGLLLSENTYRSSSVCLRNSTFEGKDASREKGDNRGGGGVVKGESANVGDGSTYWDFQLCRICKAKIK